MELPFQAEKDYLCKSCSRKIEKHGKVADNLKKSKEEIRTIFNERFGQLNLKRASEDSTCACSSLPVSVLAAKKVCLDVDNNTVKVPWPLCTSTPIKRIKTSFTDGHKSTTVSGSVRTEVKVSFITFM